MPSTLLTHHYSKRRPPVKSKPNLSMAILATAMLLAACGGGGGGNSASAPPVATAPIAARQIDYCEPGPGDQPETGLRGGIPLTEMSSTGVISGAGTNITFKGF